MEEKSVIAFYELRKKGAEKFRWKTAANFVDDEYGSGAICRNIFYFDVDAEVLEKDIKFMMKYNKKFRIDVSREIQNGANYLFISNVVGFPIWGKGLISEDLLNN